MATSLSSLHGRFPALRSRDYGHLWMGQIVSMVGSDVQTVAINRHIYALTHSPLALGLIGLARVGPIILFSLIGGALADAADRRRVLLVTQSVLMLVAATLGLLTWLHHISALLIYALSMVAASAVAFDAPARQSLTPNLVPREHLTNALSLNSIGMQTAKICGPPIAGALIASAGRGPIASSGLALTYWMNALSYLAVLGALLLLRTSGREAQAQGRVDLDSLREGLAFVRRAPILRHTITLDFFATFFSSADALLPIFAKDILHVGAKGYGVLAAAPAAGSLLAGGTLSLLPTVRRQGPVVMGAVLVYGLATVGFGLSRWYPLSLLMLAGTGASDTVSTVLRQTIRQLVTPDHLRGRMTAFNMIFFMGGPQLGELEAGVAAKWLGAPMSVIIGGVGCLITVAVMAAKAPALRRYEAPAAASE
jgi:MFS family permease